VKGFDSFTFYIFLASANSLSVGRGGGIKKLDKIRELLKVEIYPREPRLPHLDHFSLRNNGKEVLVGDISIGLLFESYRRLQF
jgi:hypothetical protein